MSLKKVNELMEKTNGKELEQMGKVFQVRVLNQVLEALMIHENVLGFTTFDQVEERIAELEAQIEKQRAHEPTIRGAGSISGGSW